MDFDIYRHFSLSPVLYRTSGSKKSQPIYFDIFILQQGILLNNSVFFSKYEEYYGQENSGRDQPRFDNLFGI